MTPSLPMETIQLIFHDLRPDPSEKVATALSVSAISQHWRAVALSTPSIWSTFCFRLRAQHIMEFLPAFFKRSLPDPLDITIAVDFHAPDGSDILKLQGTIALLRSQADRVERLHLRFLGDTGGRWDMLAQLVEFRSSSLKYLELEILSEGDARILLFDDLRRLAHPTLRWSDHCPALTHIICANPRMIIYHPSEVTYLCIKGIAGRRNVVFMSDLCDVLVRMSALTKLVIDGVSLGLLPAVAQMSLPNLRSLSLRRSPEPEGNVSPNDARQAAFFIHLLDAPGLESLTIPELNPAFPVYLRTIRPDSSIPSITHFAVASGDSQSLFEYMFFLPGVKELVLLGTDPELDGIASFSGNRSSWPDLSMIDLTELESPPFERLRTFSERLCQYGRDRFRSGYRSRVTVRLPLGVLPQHLPLNVAEFMDLHAP